ncbi:hypothetical protein GALMADRAFT_251531 [Galerina marginata CBS 339.88]|uniref:Uncharacterized protein n=1 Tax=Galerina marginata (strain CBS 339.88) TaxID=685588 RepID=A0A067SRY1_GALM3|nr:hypothetical protein GALMADRAFT_251531 [Galerina marginata CBS 339.88]
MSTVPPRWVVVDDTDVNIQYSGDGRDWVQNQGSRDDVGNFGPPYKDTLHGTIMNASLSYSFSGTQVQIFGSNNPRNDSGVIDPTWECFVDNVRVPPSDPFQFQENNWGFCGKGQLSDGPHVITVNVTVMKAQTFWFDSLQYVPSPSLALDQAAVLLDSFDPLLQYGPGWGALGGGANMTGQTNSIANIDFVGVSVSWYGFIPTELPHPATTASYAIDGGAPTSFVLRGLPASSATIYNQKFFETPTLTAGHHQLVVTYHGTSQTTPLTLDYLIIQNGTIPSSNTTTPGTSPSGDSHGSGPVKKSNNTAAIVGGIIGGLVLIAIAIAAYLYLRRREKKLNERAPVDEPAPAFVEPFHYTPVRSSVPQLQDTKSSAPVTLSYQGHSPQFSTSTFPTNTHHGSMPSFSNTELQSAIAPSSSSGTSYPSNANTYGNRTTASQSNQGYLSPTTPLSPMSDKARREAEATANVLRSQTSQPASGPSLAEDSSSRVMMHEDSGFRMPPTRERTSVVEVPPMYTPG